MAPADLLDFIEFPSLECLNAHAAHGYENALKQGYREDDGLYLESDTDEQLLINIPFNQAIKIHAITFKGPKDGSAPKLVKLFVNRPSMGFSDVESVPAAQDIVLTEALLEGQPIPLKLVKFNAVNLLSIFIASNQQDTETTKVCKIALLGQTGEVMKVAEIKKAEGS